MPTFSFTASETRRRFDYIGGVKTGPFGDGTYSSLRTSRTNNPGDSTKPPDFGTRWRKREEVRLPMNYYKLETESVVFPRGEKHLVLTYIPNGDRSEYFGVSQYGYGSVVYLQPTDAEKAAIGSNLAQRALSKVKGQSVNLGNFIAEREQALNMFGETARKLAKAFREVRRKEFGKAFKTLGCAPTSRLNGLKSPANNWLQLQYGWLPLVDDAYGAAQELENAYDEWKRDDHLSKRITTVVTATIRTDADSVSDTALGPWNPNTGVAQRGMLYRARVKLNFTVDVASSQFLGRVGLTNPLDIAWEVMPYSFVVDWFYPIGKFLNTLDATLGCTFVDGVSADRLWTNLSYTRVGIYTNGNFKYDWRMNKPVHGRFFRYERKPITGFPAVQLPQLKSPVSAKHLANSLALLTQSFFGKRT